MQSSKPDRAFQRSAGEALVNDRLGAVPVESGGVEFRVWAPHASSVNVAGRPLEPEGDGLLLGTARGRARHRLRLLTGRRRRRSPTRALAGSRPGCGAARACSTPPRSTGRRARSPCRLAELVVYELHVGTFTPAGHVRRRDRATPGPGRARRDGGRADAGRDLPRRARLGLRRRVHLRAASRPTAARRGSPASSTPPTHAVSPCSSTSSTTTSARARSCSPRSGRTSPTVTRRSGATRSTTRDRACASGRSRTPSSGCGTTAIDGLRLDATHAIFDDSEPHVLRELADRVHAAHPGALVIAEMAIGDRRPIEEWGHDAQWDDDVPPRAARPADRRARRLLRAVTARSPISRGRSRTTPAERLVICASNHDQIGNRAFGDRLPPAVRRLAAACLLFAPQVPLLFQGEEYGETAPFQFFTDHDDPAIAAATTRAGRRREFAQFAGVRRRGAPRPAGTRDLRGLEDPSGERRPRAARLLRGADRAAARQLPRTVETEVDEAARVLRVRRGDVELVADFAPSERVRSCEDVGLTSELAPPTDSSSAPTSRFAQARALVPVPARARRQPPLPLAGAAGPARARPTATTSSTRRRVSAELGGEAALARAVLRPGSASSSTSSRTTWPPARTRTSSGATRSCVDEVLRPRPAQAAHRRFFDVDDLAGVRVEDPEVFETTHALVLDLVREGLVDGLRIDHPDGLADPRGYLERLRDARRRARLGREDPRAGRGAARLAGRGHDRLRLRERRPGAVRRPAPARRLLTELAGEPRPWHEVAFEAKLEQAATTFEPEVAAAAAAARRSPTSPRALASLPVYRTYVEPGTGRVDEADRRRGRAASRTTLRRVLLLEEPGHDEFVTRFQQTTGAGDGEGRRGHRLLPLRPAARAERGRRRSGPLLARRSTSSTRANRSARDALPARAAARNDPRHEAQRRRARPDRRARRHRRAVARARSALARAQRGAPRRRRAGLDRGAVRLPDARRRLADRRRTARPRTSRKALREAKRNTSWVEPDERWEGAVIRFAHAACSRATSVPRRASTRSPREVSRSRRALRARPARPAPHLARRPRHLRRRRAAAVRTRRPRQPPAGRLGAGGDGSSTGLDATPTAASAKLWVIRELLALRARQPLAFAGTYEPLAAGPGTCAFRRGSNVLVAVSLRGERQNIGPPNENWHNVLGALPNSPATVFERF